MKTIQQLAHEIVQVAECSEEFYEVEVSILIRRHGGQKSEFFREHSDIPSDQSMTNTQPAHSWF